MSKMDKKMAKGAKNNVPMKQRTTKELRSFIELEMRRYKYILKLSTQLNVIVRRMIQEGKESSIDESKLIACSTFSQADYEVPTIKDQDVLSRVLRNWMNRTGALEEKFYKLREFLWYFSYAEIAEFKIRTEGNEKGKFIGANYHESEGPYKYPPLDELDENLISAKL
jgi:hypothetical protein